MATMDLVDFVLLHVLEDLAQEVKEKKLMKK